MGLGFQLMLDYRSVLFRFRFVILIFVPFLSATALQTTLYSVTCGHRFHMQTEGKTRDIFMLIDLVYNLQPQFFVC